MKRSEFLRVSLLTSVLAFYSLFGGYTTAQNKTQIDYEKSSVHPSHKQNSIKFHWESLPSGQYPKTGQDRKYIEDIVLESIGKYNSTKLVDTPLDFLLDDRELNVYFNNTEKKNDDYVPEGVQSTDGKADNIGFDHRILDPEQEGYFSSVATHENSHVYSIRMSETPQLRRMYEKLPVIMKEYGVPKEKAKNIYLQTLTEDELFDFCFEVPHTEVLAYTRELKNLPSLKERRWTKDYTYERHEDSIKKQIEYFKEYEKLLDVVKSSGNINTRNYINVLLAKSIEKT